MLAHEYDKWAPFRLIIGFHFTLSAVHLFMRHVYTTRKINLFEQFALAIWYGFSQESTAPSLRIFLSFIDFRDKSTYPEYRYKST